MQPGADCFQHHTQPYGEVNRPEKVLGVTPHPFNPQVTIYFRLGSANRAVIKVALVR